MMNNKRCEETETCADCKHRRVSNVLGVPSYCNFGNAGQHPMLTRALPNIEYIIDSLLTCSNFDARLENNKDDYNGLYLENYPTKDVYND